MSKELASKEISIKQNVRGRNDSMRMTKWTCGRMNRLGGTKKALADVDLLENRIRSNGMDI